MRLVQCAAVAVCVGTLGCAPEECDLENSREGNNLVADPHFDQGLLCWYAAQAGEQNRGFTTDDDAPATGSAPSARGENDAIGDTFRTQILTSYMRLEIDKTYDVSFYARAEVERPVQIYVQQCCEVPHFFLDTPETIGTSWSRYSYTFASDYSSDEAYFEVQMGGAMGAVWLDDVEIVAQ